MAARTFLSADSSSRILPDRTGDPMTHLRARFLLILFAVAAMARAQSGPDTLWTQTYGGDGNDWCYAVQQTADEGFIFAGQSNSVGNQHDVLLVRTTSDGDTVWTRRYRRQRE